MSVTLPEGAARHSAPLTRQGPPARLRHRTQRLPRRRPQPRAGHPAGTGSLPPEAPRPQPRHRRPEGTRPPPPSPPAPSAAAPTVPGAAREPLAARPLLGTMAAAAPRGDGSAVTAATAASGPPRALRGGEGRDGEGRGGGRFPEARPFLRTTKCGDAGLGARCQHGVCRETSVRAHRAVTLAGYRDVGARSPPVLLAVGSPRPQH